MATLREYYLKQLDGLGIHNDVIVENKSTRAKSKILESTIYNSNAGVCYVGYFFPSGSFTLETVKYLLAHTKDTVERAKKMVKVKSAHTSSDPEDSIDLDKLPFSDMAHIYIDDNLDKKDRDEIRSVAGVSNLKINLRDRHFSDWISEHEKPWAFISHDSRNKDEIARPLAEKLSSMMCPVWYDEYSLQVGQSIRESIDSGLGTAKRCIIILSPEFISNPGWTKAEFNAIVNKHITVGGNVLLPVWHNISKKEVEKYSPIVIDIKGLDTTIGIDELAKKLFIAITK